MPSAAWTSTRLACCCSLRCAPHVSQVKGLDTEALEISHIQVNRAQKQRRRDKVATKGALPDDPLEHTLSGLAQGTTYSMRIQAWTAMVKQAAQQAAAKTETQETAKRQAKRQTKPRAMSKRIR